MTPTALPAASSLDAYVAHREAELGMPTFVWLNGQASTATNARDAAWQVLRELAPTYGLSPAAVQATKLRRLHDIGSGAIIAQFEQEVEGLEVFRLQLNIALNRDLKAVGASGHLSAHVEKGPNSQGFALSSEDAVARAIAAMTGARTVVTTSPGAASQAAAPAGYVTHDVAAFAVGGTRYRAATPPRAKPVFYPAKKSLIPAYYVELDLSMNDQPDSSLHSYVISASDGTVLFENDLVANDSYTYRVWADKDGSYTPWDGPHGTAFTPHPTGKRDGTNLSFVPSQLVTLANAPFSKNDPWLPAMATEARGNNAVAYADTTAPDGFSMGDVMLKPSAMGEFNFALSIPKDDPAANSTTIQAVTTNFFYIINHLHDTYYDAGWDEASRNPQQDNFGRGGVAGDPIRAESQDNSGRNNANASTPADGTSPRIQMYLFDPREDPVRVVSPMDLARVYQVGRAAFGPSLFDVTSDLVLGDDGMGVNKNDGCESPYTNAMAVKDKIAIIDRGNCFFEDKAYNAQVNGAKAVIIVSNVADPPGTMASAPTPPPMPVTIPAMLIGQADGNAIKAKLAAGTAVTMALKATLHNNDSSLDGMIVSHEWGHVLSNRLIGNSNGLVNNQGRSMGEGWSDFVALLMTTRSEDLMAMSNANWTGAFGAAAYSTGPGGNAAYDGIRRYPYSTDFAKNPLMFHHITNGQPLPMMPAPSFGQDGGSNAEVHNTGEVWSNTLWECYVALLRDTARYNFAQASKAMREYLVSSLKLTPNAPTILEARDAVLLAALAKDQKDFELFARAFARRGMGVGAVGPTRGSTDHSGVVESTAVGSAIVIESVTLTDAAHSCDKDGILDEGELGILTVKLRNTGTLPLTAQARVTSDSDRVDFGRSDQISFPTAQPFQSTTGRLVVSLKSAPVQLGFELAMNIQAPNLAVPGAVVVRRAFVGNYDLVPASSSSDTMNDPSPGWTTAGNTMLDSSQPWQHVRDGADGRWVIVDNTSPSDQSLVTPALQVSATGSLGFVLTHRHSFEADALTNYDGGVIEISTDDGMTWSDIGMMFTRAGYNGTLWSQNVPLKDRKAFANKSPGYPAWITTEANLGTAYAGKTVKLRFRVGTDPAEGGAGWELNDLSFTGLANQPFSSRQASTRCPTLPRP